MKKKALTTVALGAATLAAGMAGNVHADSVKVTKQQIGDETKITTTTTKDVNQQKIAQDKQNISSQQTVVNSAKSSLDKAKANASSASQVVSSAQSKVNDAKKALDIAKASQPDQIKHQVAADQSQVNTDKQNISSTQSSITTDKSNVAKDQQAINNVGQKAQQDQNKLNNDQSKLSSAQSTLNNDQNKLNSVNSQLSNIESQEGGEQVTFPPLPNDWLTQVKAYLNGQIHQINISDEEQSNDLDKLENELQNTVYKENAKSADANESYTPGKLTPQQKVDLNIYAGELINSARAQLGLNPVKINQEMIDTADKVVAGYEADNFNMVEKSGQASSHDEKALDAAGVGTECGGSCWGVTYSSLQGVKDYIADIIASSLVNDSIANWGHCLTYLSNPSNGSDVWMGLGIDKWNNLHFVFKTPSNTSGNLLSSSSDLQKQKDNLQNQANQLQNTVNKDEQVVNDLQNQVNADKAQLQKDTPAGLQQQLQNDQKKLADDQATLQKQQQKLAQDEAQLKADQNKLNSITPEDIANAQKALEQAQTNYNSAVKALNEAQSKANVSNDELAKAQQNYINALNKLNELKQILENDEKQITTTSVQWIKNQHPTTTSSMGNKVVLHSSSKANASSIVSSEKEANTVHADTVSAVKLAQTDAIHFTSEAPASSKKADKKNALPQMGDENSNKTVWGEISLAMAGVLATLGLADRKRRN